MASNLVLVFSFLFLVGGLVVALTSSFFWEGVGIFFVSLALFVIVSMWKIAVWADDSLREWMKGTNSRYRIDIDLKDERKDDD